MGLTAGDLGLGSRGTPYRRVELRIAPEPSQISTVRRALEALGVPEGPLYDAKLLLTELVTNSVKHAGLGPDATIQVTATRSNGRLRVCVQDRAVPALDPLPAAI